MDRLRKAQIIDVVILAVLGAGLALGLTSAGSLDGLPPAFAVITGLVIVAAIVLVGKAIFELAFLRMRVVRKLVLGRYDIDGTWFNIVRDDEGTPVGIGASRISCARKGPFMEWTVSGEEYGLSITREGFQLDLAKGFSFGDRLTGMEWPRLSYVYEATRSDKAVPEGVGFGYLEFSWRRSSIPRRGVGLNYGMGIEQPLEITSFRLDESGDSALIDQLGSTPADVVRGFDQLWNRFGAVEQESATVVLGKKSSFDDESEARVPEIPDIPEMPETTELKNVVDFEEEWETHNGSSYSEQDR